MELLPSSAPVYGGGLIVTYIPEDYIIPDGSRAFLVFQGVKQRQVTEAKILSEDNAFHAVIPDHEPPEQVTLSAYIQSPNNECKCIASEKFVYYLDQTCYLARYLADSVLDLESLEDWDNIQGPNYSLEQEDFSTLDERLTSAFQHLVLPSNWNLCGEPGTEHTPRETLLHFASRLGLSTFVALLLEKKGAEECVLLKNCHGELAREIAVERGFVELANLISNPRIHGGIRWESKERVGQTVIVKRHSFETIFTTSEPHNGVWPPLEEEIGTLNKESLSAESAISPSGLEDFTMWEDDENDSPRSDQPLGGYFEEEYESEEDAVDSEESLSGEYQQTSNFLTNELENVKSSQTFLTGNLQHIQEIKEGIRQLRQKDAERLKESGVLAQPSTSTSDFAYDPSAHDDVAIITQESVRTTTCYETSSLASERLDEQMVATDVRDDSSHRKSPRKADDHKSLTSDVKMKIKNDASRLSPNPLQRRHSWHSTENLQDDDETSLPTAARSSSFHQSRNDDTASEDAADDQTCHRASLISQRGNSVDSVSKIWGGGHQSMVTTSGDVSTLPGMINDVTKVDGNVILVAKRSGSLHLNNSNITTNLRNDSDRRFTISEGLLPNSSNFSDENPTSGLSTASPLKSFRSEVPHAKNLTNRTLSFLGKMRSGTKNKPKDKNKVKNMTDSKFGSRERLQEEEEDSFDCSDANKDQNKKTKRPSIIQRPQSMMISRPPNYAVGNSATNYQSAANPSGRSNSRPISAMASNQLVPNSFQDSAQSQGSVKSNRSSYYEEEDGPTPFRLKDVMSGSTESLDETAVMDTTELENDPDLCLKVDEPGTWSVTVDKKVLKKMEKKDVKRQENIFEFIQTERNHLTTLKIMQKIYAHGMLHEANVSSKVVEQLFPLIDEHVEYVSQFVSKLNERQNESKVVDGIGDLLVAQWKDEKGCTMKRLMGDFCSKQNEITTLYKDLYKSDKKVQALMRKCEKNRLTRRQDIPGCALLVTQRTTKYPIMVQTLVENTVKKHHKEDFELLEEALSLSKEIAKNVDEQVQASERQQLLKEIHEKTESKSNTAYKNERKFGRQDLKRRNRKLLYHSNSVQWHIKDSKKFTEVQFMLLTDCIVFLQENNGKFTFPSGQPAAVPLQKLIVREVANDEKGLYLMSMSSQQMYKLKLTSADECKTLTHTIQMAVNNCPDEDEGVSSEDEEERKNQERRLDRALTLIAEMERKDEKINGLLTEKMELFLGLAESVDRGNAVANMHFHIPLYSDGDESGNNNKSTLPLGKPVLLKAIEQISQLSHAYYGSSSLSRHPTSVGEHGSSSRSHLSLPKRADTFGGFENDKEPPSSRDQWSNSSQGDITLDQFETDQSSSESSNRDSGLIDSDASTRKADSESSIPKALEPDMEISGSTATSEGNSNAYLPPTSNQVTLLTTLAHLLNQYLSMASQQDTRIEKLQLQLSQDRPISKKRTSGNLQEAELKRNQIKQQEQVDNLRKQQQQLKTEREQWRREKERYQKSFEYERVEIETEKTRLVTEKEEHERQKEEVARSKEYYQHEVKRLKEMQRKVQHGGDIHTSASTPALPNAANRNNSNNSLNEMPDTTDSRLSIFSSKSSLQQESSRKGPSSPTYPVADYPKTFPGPKTGAGTAHQVPLHLHSATNQVTTLQTPKHQDINPKLLSKLASSSKPQTKPHGKIANGDKAGGANYTKSNKLSKRANLGSNQHHNSSTSLDSLRSHIPFGNSRRKHAHTDPPHPSSKITERTPIFSSKNASFDSDSSVNRSSSNSSTSSKEEDRRSRSYTTVNNTGTSPKFTKKQSAGTIELFL